MANDTPKKPKAKRDDPKQSERFIKAAREIEADESPEIMERAFAKIISPPKKKP